MNYFENGVEYSEFERSGKKFKRRLVRTGTHFMSNSRIYSIWKNMRRRCNNPNSPKYKFYGGKGIRVCDEWNTAGSGFDNFLKWSLANGYNEILTIDRIESDKNYCPENCRWITFKENVLKGVSKPHIPEYIYTGINHSKNMRTTFFKVGIFHEQFGIDGRRISDCCNGIRPDYKGWNFTRRKLTKQERQETIQKWSTVEVELLPEVRGILLG